MNTVASQGGCRAKLEALTAADLMSSDPISVRHDAPVYDVLVLMTERRINAAPVINDAGRPVGVLSMSDVLIHERELADFRRCRERPSAAIGSREPDVRDGSSVGDLMTPTVITVGLETPAPVVVEKMIAMKVHQLFVADPMGTLAGVITPLDVLRKLHER
jgi:CBS-domain-containing membrane protein